jgi:hypothetical protein
LLGRLRHRRFYSLAELNTAIGELLRQLNDERPIRRLGVTRRTLFEELDRPNLKSLPAQSYCFLLRAKRAVCWAGRRSRLREGRQNRYDYETTLLEIDTLRITYVSF